MNCSSTAAPRTPADFVLLTGRERTVAWRLVSSRAVGTGFDSFGMGYATDAADTWRDQLYVANGTTLGILDTATWTARRDLMQAAEKLHAHLGEAISDDFNAFSESTKAAAKKLKLDLKPADLKAILDAVSWRDPEAKPIVLDSRILDIPVDYDFEAARCFTSELKDGTRYSYEPDSELRDTENVPLTYPGGIVAYFQKEVLPHVPDAWVDEEKTVIGYEISFNKYFYQHQPLRPRGADHPHHLDGRDHR
jgi:hypothetical protein